MSTSDSLRKPIQQLPTYVANQIAAGEVIERPASVVKELIENSLDADASQLDIDIEQGGLQRIQVRDNGHGIAHHELMLALDRHATSKISDSEDIAHITSFGFRGEALASISSVARVVLTSRTSQAEHGWQVISLPGQIPSDLKPMAHPVGTTIEVSDLFHQTPARRRFLRTASTEFSRIHTIVKCLSLGNFEFGLTLRHHKRLVLSLPTSLDDNTRAQRMRAICGDGFADTAISLSAQATGLKLWGWIGSPHNSRSQADLQYFYVNSRLIRDKRINYAVKQAYQDVLYQGRYPAVILFLTIDPTEIDVNVHPTKAEVRFRQSQLIYNFIRKSLQAALSKGPSSPSLNSSSVPFVNPAASPSTTVSALDEGWDWTPHKPSFINPTFESQPEKIESITQATPPLLADILPQLGFALAQLHGIYILAENQTGLIIIDTHAAHERILYEQLKLDIAKAPLPTQQLLVPITLTLNSEASALVKTHAALFERFGFACEHSEPNTLAVRTIPSLLKTIAIGPLLQDVFSDLQVQAQSSRIEQCFDTFLSSLACRSALHAHHKLSIAEMNQLLRQMETTQRSAQCNHGRPSWKQLTLQEMDKWFLRGR